jgi:hypothetical protein
MKEIRQMLKDLDNVEEDPVSVLGSVACRFLHWAGHDIRQDCDYEDLDYLYLTHRFEAEFAVGKINAVKEGLTRVRVVWRAQFKERTTLECALICAKLDGAKIVFKLG